MTMSLSVIAVEKQPPQSISLRISAIEAMVLRFLQRGLRIA